MPEHLHKRKHLTSFQLIILGFAGVILIHLVGKNSQMNNKLLPYTISGQNGVYNKSKVKSNIEFPPLPDFLSPDGNNQPRSILYQKNKIQYS